MTTKDQRLALFDQVTSDECYEAGCPDYREYQEEGRNWGHCQGNSETCPVVEQRIDNMRDMEEFDR